MTVEQTRSIDQYGSIDTLWDAVKDAQPQISFWGSRFVRCVLGDEPLLSQLTDKTLSLCHLNDVDDIPMDQRRKGICVLQRLRKFYTDIDALIEKANIITRIFFYIRELFGANGSYAARLCLEDWEPKSRLEGFTKEQYEQHFPEPEYAITNSSSWISSSDWGGVRFYLGPRGTELNPCFT
jgi:hypothetical protein